MVDYKKFLNQFGPLLLDRPLLAAIMIIDFVVLLFHRPPVFFSLLMLLGLVGLAMYFSRELAKSQLAASTESKQQV